MASSPSVLPRPNHQTRHLLSGIDVDYFDLTTKKYCWPPGVNATGRRMLFSGPDGDRNHRVSYLGNHMYIGTGTMSKEGTSSVCYITRPNWKNAPHLYRKHERTSEIGWGIPQLNDPISPSSGYQIRRGFGWGGAEDKFTHRYQNPWNPKPGQATGSAKRPHTAPPAFWSRKSSSSSSQSSLSSVGSLPPGGAPRFLHSWKKNIESELGSFSRRKF